MSKKELRDQLLRQMNDTIMIGSENHKFNTINKNLESQLQSAEHALDKYKSFLSISIEDL